MKLNFFTKIFGLLIISVLVVFGLQYFVRGLYFQDAYINTVVNRNVAIIEEVVERVYLGEDVYDILDDLEVTDLNFYEYYDEDEAHEQYGEFVVDNDEVSDEYSLTDSIYYMVVEDEFGYENSTYHVYIAELEDGSVLVFDQYLTGLVDANAALASIDVYILLGVLVIFIPISVWFSTRMSKPLKLMKKQARELGNLEFNEPLNIRTNDEIEDLSKSINLVSLKLKTAIDELKDDIEKERIKDQKRRELIASLSHELKTPLTTMRGVVEGMIDNVGSYKDKEKYLKETLKYLSFMEDLSKDIIDVVSYESKKVNRVLHNFSTIVDNALDYVDADLVTLDIEDSVVYCNEDMIRRTLINLISNGIKYSNDSKVIVRSYLKDKLIIEVENEGNIPDSEIEKIYEPFYRLEKSRNKSTGGSGLGLFIVRTILDAHSSKYSMENKGNNVVFRFTLDTDTTLTKV